MRVRRSSLPAGPDPAGPHQTNNYVRVESGDVLTFDDRFAEARARAEQFVRDFTLPGKQPRGTVWRDYPGRPAFIRLIGSDP